MDWLAYISLRTERSSREVMSHVHIRVKSSRLRQLVAKTKRPLRTHIHRSAQSPDRNATAEVSSLVEAVIVREKFH